MSFDPAGVALRACLARGVREFVVCGGARNAPLVLGLARMEGEGVKVWRHFEERGAGFFALGRVMATDMPVVVVTTSGTAVAELLPAVIEAHYQGRPLVLVTADRPERFRGSGAPQAIEQGGIFGEYVEGVDDLGGGEMLDAGCGMLDGWSGLRPWQLNVCLEEDVEVPVVKVPEGEAERPKVKRPGVVELVEFLREGVFRGVAVMLGGLEPEEQEAAYDFVKRLGAPVVADATSGLREALGALVMADGDGVLKGHPPGKVLRLGDVPVGRFWRDLEELPGTEVLSVTRTGFSGLARESTVLAGRVDHVVRGMGEAPVVGDALDHLRRAGKRAGVLDELLVRYPDSEPAMVRLLSTFATVGESVFLGNSLPIREWNLCAQGTLPIVNVRANRGANGIDGQLSTWLGVTAGHEGAWGVFGDLTALYDLAAPALLEQVEGSGRVLAVINNGGGRIFERLPRLSGMSEAERQLMTNAHATRFESWAAMWEMDYSAVNGQEEMDIEPGERPLLVEIRPDAKQTGEFWSAWGKRR